jgi:hypothetical protein
VRRVSRQSKVFTLRRRAQILLASDARSSAPEIARVLQTDENQVRRVIASARWRQAGRSGGRAEALRRWLARTRSRRVESHRGRVPLPSIAQPRSAPLYTV